ncbi:MAG: CPBP family intramembrane metalloprotease, partial [Candidatus Eisenbacteria bacterium]|nr:CPBP family intramembrane metalloprotease [Candidatus Eisenbacteria bacterium]
DWQGLSLQVRQGPEWWPEPAGGVAAVALFLLGFLLQGGTEELVVRGYVYRNLRDRWSWANAAALSSLLFAIGHGFNPDVTPVSIINTFLIGILFAMSVEWSGSLWLAFLLHGFWNFATGCVLSLPVSGMSAFHIFDVTVSGARTWTGGAYGPEGSLFLTLMLAPLVFLLAHRLEKRRPAHEVEE